ncbi:MAG: NADH-quinone oxidoreductase subunit J [Hyphomicrobiales bacterium]
MILTSLFFYLFAAITVAAAFMVISSRNPVHSVLWLILAFFNSAALFLMLGAEFLAMILIVVYVGAVAVLFLFVVMMLDVDFAELRQGFLQYLPIGSIIGIILLIELIMVLASYAIAPEVTANPVVPIPDASQVSNTEALGLLIYTKYIYFFQAAGMVLLVAMIGAIVLTLRHKEGVKRQNIADQVARRPETSIEVRKVESGKGI